MVNGDKMSIELLVEQSQVFQNTVAEKGEGSLIALKLALQSIQPDILVLSPGALSQTAHCLQYTTYVSDNPLPAARALSHTYKKHGKDASILVVAGDVNTEKNLAEFEKADEDLVYICINNAGSSSCKSRKPVESALVPFIKAAYAATCSVAHPEDFMKKLLKVKETEGFSFLDVHCPSPSLWGYEPSNTIIVSRTAVASWIWPLYEIDKKAVLTHRPNIPEGVDRYINLQDRFSELDLETLRELAEKNITLFPQKKR